MPDLRIVAPSFAPGAPLAQRTDDELMLLASAGAKDAFGALAERHMTKLANFCAKLICDSALGEEVAQETWLAVWNQRRSYQPEGKFTAYLYTVGRNRCRKAVRDRGRRSRWFVSGAPEQAVAAATGDHLDTLLEEERRRRFQKSLSRLPVKLREALILRFSEGLEYEDMSRILGRSESTIRSRVHHALKKLRSQTKGALP